ncbi:MAG: hypothetical protein HY304_03950 [candidate division Zixibacteria bacterium]|nr:hypothetical protein [candidate division Zixibacteria bacterium]
MMMTLDRGRRALALVVLAPLALAATAQGAMTGSSGKGHGISVRPAAIDNRSSIGVNNLQMMVSNVGSFAYDPSNSLGKSDGLYFPRGAKTTVVFAGGLWVGARVNGSPRIALAEYSNEYSPGGMANGTFIPDQGRFHVYKISRGDDAAGNSDWANWPFADGAPALKNAARGDSLDEHGHVIPEVLGDQALYSVYNDANPGAHTNRAGSTAPLGLEVRQYVFAFARGGALGNTIYLRFRIINNGANRLDDTYISIWCDPDVGDASDDFVGCDTTLSLGYAYNSGPDAIYGDGVPAVGFDFLQGPIVPAPGDSAHQGSRWVHDYRNLPMTSFNAYVNGTDPTNSIQTYNYMRGLLPNGSPVVDPVGDTTVFMNAGDPVTGAGWLDVNPSDRRFMMTSGPFTMVPGDTQEVVVAVLVGQSGDPIASITDLRSVDQKAQAVFDLNFQIPFPPPPPTVWTQPLPNHVELIWSTEAEGDVQVSDVLGQRFVMEGYNVYQGQTASGPWKRIATFDVDDAITRIYEDEFDPQLGAVQRVLVQSGSNSGLQNHLSVTDDRFDGGELINHRPYYFAVTAYSYDTNDVQEYRVGPNVVGHLTEELEDRMEPTQVIPNSVALTLVDTAAHVSGQSDGRVTVRILEPAQVTGNDYQVTFDTDRTWNLDNLTTGTRLLAKQTHASGDFDYSLTEGLMVQVYGPEPGIKNVEWSGSKPWATGVDWGGASYGGSVDQGANFFGSSIIDPAQLVNVELRFSTTTTQKGYRYIRGADPNYQYDGYCDVPFTAWDISADPPRQLNVCFVEQFQLASEDCHWLPPDDDPATGGREYLFILNSDYASEPSDYYTSRSIRDNADEMDVLYAWWPTVAPGHSSSELADGQSLKISVNKINTQADRFTFTPPRAGAAGADQGGLSLNNIHPVPNPYLNERDLVEDPRHRQIKFVNFPAVPATLEIYNLAGELIRAVQKSDPASSFMTWDVLTENGLPPASGIYIYRITSPGLKPKVGKLGLFTEREKLGQF